MPSKLATLGELGWLSILDEMDIKRVAYFFHHSQMNDDRLTKIVFQQLNECYQMNIDLPFNYMEYMKNIFVNRGLDHMFQDAGTNSCSVTKFKAAVSKIHCEVFMRKMEDMSSLRVYRLVKENTHCSPYLLSKEGTFKAKQLKFKLRTGVSGLGDDLYRQHRNPGLCKYCNKYENLQHFLLMCPAYHDARVSMMTKLKDRLDPDVFSFYLHNIDLTIYAMLGDHATLLIPVS
jgi:hypothetical protein